MERVKKLPDTQRGIYWVTVNIRAWERTVPVAIGVRYAADDVWAHDGKTYLRAHLCSPDGKLIVDADGNQMDTVFILEALCTKD